MVHSQAGARVGALLVPLPLINTVRICLGPSMLKKGDRAVTPYHGAPKAMDSKALHLSPGIMFCARAGRCMHGHLNQVDSQESSFDENSEYVCIAVLI